MREGIIRMIGLHYTFTSFSCPKVDLDTLESEHTIQVFDRDELDGCGGSKSRPHRHKSTPEAKDAILGRQLGRTVEEALVLSGLVSHQGCTDPVDGTDGTGHGETRDHTGTEGRLDVLPSPACCVGDGTLGNIIHTHLGRIEDTCTQDVGRDALVKECDAARRVRFLDKGRQPST